MREKPVVQGARRSAPHFLNDAGVLEQSVEHASKRTAVMAGLACFDRQVVRNASAY